MILLRSSVLIILLLAAGPLCLAQSGQSDTAQEQDVEQSPGIRYLVEVIAFEYQGPDSSGGEVFDRLKVEEYLPRKPFDFDEYNRIQEAVTYTDLVHLEDALQRLMDSPQYTVMTRAAWVQPLLNRNEAVDVPLGYESRVSTDPLHSDSREPASSRISGKLRVYGDHLLFLDLDLEATLPRRAGSESYGQGDGSLNGSLNGGFDRYSSGGGFETYRIAETRRIKLEEFHYFDHPYIGAVVSVRRYEKP